MKIENLGKFLSEVFKQSGNQLVKVYELTRKVKFESAVYEKHREFFSEFGEAEKSFNLPYDNKVEEVNLNELAFIIYDQGFVIDSRKTVLVKSVTI